MPAPTLVNYTAKTVNGTTASPISTTFTVTNNNALILVLANFLYNATDPTDRWITGVTIGGTTANEAYNEKATSTNRRYASGLYWLADVSSGSKAIDVTMNNSFSQVVCYVVEISGHHATSPIRQSGGNLTGASLTSATLSVSTSETESLWVASARTQDGDKTISPAGGSTEVTENRSHATNDWAVVANLMTRSGSGSYSLGGSWTGAINGGGVMAIEIAPVAAAPGGNATMYYAMMSAN